MVDNNEEKLNNIDDFVETNESIIDATEEEILLVEEEVAEDKEFIRNEEIKQDGKFLHYVKVLASGFVDQIFAVGLALVGFGILTLILRVFGYEIVVDMKQQMFMIIYIISNVLYYPIIAEFLHGKTLGKKFLFR